MGVEKDRISIRLSDSELRKLDRLQRALGPLAKNRSATIALLIEVLEEKLPRFETLLTFNMAMTLLGAAQLLQRMLRPTLCVKCDSFELPQIEFPVRAGQEQPVGNHTSLTTQPHRFQLVNPRSYADRLWAAGASGASASPRVPAKLSAWSGRLA